MPQDASAASKALLEQSRAAVWHRPVSTYRLQLGADFTFRDAQDILPYLAELGVTDCYLSPFFQPCSEASHGYDVADHGRINEALGGEPAYQAFCEAARRHGVGQVLDVVPNHMGITGGRNQWWLDVLENGPSSPYAPFFDIDWDPPKPELKHRVLLPILGDQYGRVLETQELRLEFQDGGFLVRYYDAVLPIGPRTYAQILRLRLDQIEAELGKDHPHFQELQSIITATSHLPGRTDIDPVRRAERSREKGIIKRRLDTLSRESPAVKAFIDENVRLFNGIQGEPGSFDRLDALLAEQPYRVAYWGVATDEINYRRFFDINGLAAIRMEEPQVFEAAHRLIFRLIREGCVSGLRIDHPDGLHAPAQYLRKLQRHAVLETARRLQGVPEPTPGAGEAVREAAPLAQVDRRLREDSASDWSRPFYVVVEKVLMPGESLPATWPVHGTTGYDFLNALNGLFVDPGGARAFDQIYQRLTGFRRSFGEVVYESKKLITQATMSSEVTVLGHRLARIAEKHRESRDFTDRSLTDALREIIACFPVYRTYVGDDSAAVSECDRRYLEQAVAAAKRRNPTTSASVFDFIRDILCRRSSGRWSDTDLLEEAAFVMAFQQVTGPITAKGVEDTASYRYTRLVSLNEVGGEPSRFGIPLEAFHGLNAARLARWPGSLSSTSTHDTKRSEDVRARLNVLSEIPHEWRARLRTWFRLNRPHRSVLDRVTVPDPNEEYLLYQTLLGAWPIGPVSDGEYEEFTERIQRYMRKALREAKVHMSWVNPNPDYDEAVRRFIAAILDRSSGPPPERQPGPVRRLLSTLVPGASGNVFLHDFLPFQRKIATCGMFNSLSQTLLKLASPGVADTYRGTEIWDLSLVDPDNRRPVDFARRRAMVDELRTAIAQTGSDLSPLARSLVDSKEDGRIKLYLTMQGLRYRRQHPTLFLAGAYLPLEAAGSRKEHLSAFARRTGSHAVVAVAPRFVAQLNLDGPPLGTAVWQRTWLPLPAEWPRHGYRNVLTGEVVPVSSHEGRPALPVDAVLSSFPVALLELEGDA
jgi:(1->4)-alpha-D-glucan 1-alpha-D-glucosylmutase